MAKKKTKSYPLAWSPEEIQTYEETGVEPDKTSNGLWVSDVERETKPLGDWSVAELFALASGELFTTHLPGTDEFYAAVNVKAKASKVDTSRWGEDDLYNWLMFGKEPEVTPNGYFINDPERWTKKANEWEDEELQDLGFGRFGDLDRDNEYILDEASERFNLPDGITFEDFCAWTANKTLPELTESGVLINDRHRARKPIEEWDDDELWAWVTDEISAPEDKEDELLQVALVCFGGTWYWSKANLKEWLVSDKDHEVEVDFSLLPDAYLAKLLYDEHELDPKASLHSRAWYHEILTRHDGVIKPFWSIQEIVDFLNTGYIPEPPSEEEEELSEPVAEVIFEEEEEPVEEEVVDEAAVEEEEIEEVQEAEVESWTEFISNPTLASAMAVETDTSILDLVDMLDAEEASEWPVEALVAWSRDEIATGSSNTTTTMCDALRSLCIDEVDNWTDHDVKLFVSEKTIPLSVDGVWINDRNRSKSHPSLWSDAALKAWANGDIESGDHAKNDIVLAARIRFKIPDRISDEDAMAFISTGIMPTEKIAVFEDPTLATDEQLLAWAQGTVDLSDICETAAILKELRVRQRIHEDWTDSQVLVFLRTGKVPKLTTTGVLVESRTRDAQSPAKWQWDELKALALGEIASESDNGALFTLDSEAAVDRVKYLIKVQFGPDAGKWSVSETLAYLVSGKEPIVLESGVYVNDPSRPLRSAEEWSKEELTAWLAGKIKASEKATAEALWHEVYVRFDINPCWYHDDARDYVLQGVVVPSLPSGIYIRDKHRDARPAREWTKRELKAWCRGQILPGPNATEDELVLQAAKLFHVSTMLDRTNIKKRIASINEESMTMTVKFVTEDLASYVKGREEAGSNVSKAAPYQSLLDRCINRVLRLEGDDFVQGWTELLKFFYTHQNGIMSSRRIFVGVGQMTITPRGLRNFQSLTSILQNTCDPTKRDVAVKMIDWSVALKEVTNEKSRQSILSYYGAM